MGAVGPSVAAMSAGSLKISAPMVTLTMLAARAKVPIDRRRDDSGTRRVSGRSTDGTLTQDTGCGTRGVGPNPSRGPAGHGVTYRRWAAANAKSVSGIFGTCWRCEVITVFLSIFRVRQK